MEFDCPVKGAGQVVLQRHPAGTIAVKRAGEARQMLAYSGAQPGGSRIGISLNIIDEKGETGEFIGARDIPVRLVAPAFQVLELLL
jgi:hypothetical protein